MASRSCALFGVVLLLCVSFSCAHRFLQDSEKHADDWQLSGKNVGVVKSDVADQGISIGEGYGHGQGYSVASGAGEGYGWGEGSGGGEGYGIGEGSGSGSYGGGGQGMGEGIGQGGGGQGIGEGIGQGGGPGSYGPSWGPGGSGRYPGAGCCPCGIINFPMPFFHGPFPGFGYYQPGAKGDAAVTETHHMNMVKHEPMPPMSAEMMIPEHMNNAASDEELHM